MKMCIMLLLTGWMTLGTAQANLVAGPNGGKVVGVDPDRAEVVIRDDGVLAVSFIDVDNKVTSVGDRVVSVFALLDSGRKEITLQSSGEGLVSSEPLPQPEGYTILVQIRASTEAKPVNSRIQYITHVCGGCQLKEYACVCEDH